MTQDANTSPVTRAEIDRLLEKGDSEFQIELRCMWQYLVAQVLNTGKRKVVLSPVYDHTFKQFVTEEGVMKKDRELILDVLGKMKAIKRGKEIKIPIKDEASKRQTSKRFFRVTVLAGNLMSERSPRQELFVSRQLVSQRKEAHVQGAHVTAYKTTNRFKDIWRELK